MTLDDLQLAYHIERGKVTATLHPKNRPYRPDRPTAELRVPVELWDNTDIGAIVEAAKERVMLDLDEAYARGPFHDRPDDPHLREMREALEA